jgi:hypothetical protein
MHRYRPSPAMAIALVALFVALGGTSYPASHARSPHRRPYLTGVARAYGWVRPLCVGCDPVRGFTPLVREQSMNVTLGSPHPGAPVGTWCFRLSGGINPSKATVVTSTTGDEGSPDARFKSAAGAEWVPYNPNCPPNEIEVQTFTYIVEGTHLVISHAERTPFSFVVLGRENA